MHKATRKLRVMPSVSTSSNNDQALDGATSLPRPFDRLATETLTQILHQAITLHPYGYGFKISSYRGSPWALSHVCHQWRAIVVPCCALWASFHITPKCSLSMHKLLRLLNRVLVRSQLHPLSFSVSISPWVRRTAPDTVIPIYRALAGHSRKWSNVALRLDWMFCSRLRVVENKLDLLRRLRIQGSINPAMSTAFSSAPRLEHLEFHLDRYPGVFCHARVVPWAQLSTLVVDVSDLGEPGYLLDALTKAQSLENLTLLCHKFDDFDDDDDEEEEIVLPCLRSLTTNRVIFLMVLALPVLQALECLPKASASPCSLIMHCIAEDVSDFACLTRLRLFDNEDRSRTCIAALGLLSNLEVLEIHVVGEVRDSYLEPLLLELKREPNLLPWLREFVFEEELAEEDVDADAAWTRAVADRMLLEMVEARVPVMKVVRVVLQEAFGGGVRDGMFRMAELEKGGVHFDLETYVIL